MEDIQDWQWQMEINGGLRDKVNRNFDQRKKGAGQISAEVKKLYWLW